MSISGITPYTPAASSTEPPIQKDPNSKGTGYRLIKANINFLWKKFTDGMVYPTDFKDNLKPTPTNIRYYSDIEVLTKSYNLPENGFQYYQLEKESPFSSAIERFAKAPRSWFFSIEKESELFSQAEQFLSSWGKANKIPGIPVIVNTVYRNSDPAFAEERPFFLAHVDMCKEDLINPLSSRGKYVYKHGAEKVFGKMSDEDYKKVKHHAQLNMWIPLHEEPSHNTLAVMNTKSVQDLPKKLRPVSTDVGTIFGLHPDKGQEWVVKKDLTLKDRTVILFGTLCTPHTAINIEGVPESPRMSVEFRVDFITPGQRNDRALLIIIFIIISFLASYNFISPK